MRATTGNDYPLFAMGAPYYPKRATAPETRAATGARGAPDGLIAMVLRRGDAQRLRQAYELMGHQWEPLPGAESEVKAIHALFRSKRSRLLVAAEASESNLLARNASGELARYRYLHFAAHGHLSTDAPLLSALVLAQGENPLGHRRLCHGSRVALVSTRQRPDRVIRLPVRTGQSYSRRRRDGHSVCAVRRRQSAHVVIPVAGERCG